MKSYSQNNETELVQKYFQSNTGTFLDLGSNNGTLLSNTYDLFLRGWGGVCVEAAITPFKELSELYKDSPQVKCLNVAVGTEDNEIDFYESGEHLGKGDSGLLSTASLKEMSRWVNEKFTPTRVRCFSFKSLLELSPYRTFDMISCDIEGLDFQVLTQMDLNKLKCKLLIVETNSIEDEKYINYCKQFDMRVLCKNAENLIFVK